MCDIWKSETSRPFTLAQLMPLLPAIRELGVRWIVLSGGEPLLNPELSALCSVLKKEGLHLTLLTTGLLLEKRAEEVVESFDDVIVSLDGPPAIHDRVRQVRRAFAVMQSGIAATKLRRPGMRITARTTVQKANHLNLRETVAVAKSLGLDGISFLAADLTSEAFNRAIPWSDGRRAEVGLTAEEVEALAAEIEAVIVEFSSEIGEGYIAESPEKLRRIVHHFRAHLGFEQPQSPRCNAPWVSAVIETDGTIRPCFFHRPIGTLQNASLPQILNSEQGVSFRAALDVANNPICNRCVCSLNYREVDAPSFADLSQGSSE
jgi:MoaA/NifB/PqqE/SkfB family radical SAM enzyme